jgi:class 3 adenylate cyclase/tetratricopeptide (TPR) repeat protein
MAVFRSGTGSTDRDARLAHPSLRSETDELTMAMPPPDRDSERRHVSVLFADISGFSAMAERTDPEDLTATVNSCLAILEDVVHGHGGHVDKYIGDCIMALFGAPQALEDAPRRAVNAAIDMRNRVGQLDPREGSAKNLGLHIGINSGLVIAGEVGGVKREFTVLGDTVNVASRLKDLAPSGAIYVGAETHRYTRDEFEYRELGPLALKGKEERVPAFELLSVREQLHRPTSTRTGMIISGLVGRSDELAMLRRALAGVVGGSGGIVNLVGEAGMGKSRLVAEAMTQSGAPADAAATVLEGRSLSMGLSLSFHPFVDLLRHWAGITEDDTEPRALSKLEGAMHAVLAEETDEIFPFVATLMGMRVTGGHAERIEGIEGEALEKVMLKSMRELLRKLAARHPLVLVFEDVHWADRSSIQLLEVLFRLVENDQILFVNVFRPDTEGTGAHVLQVTQAAYANRLTSIHLERLSEKEADQLIQNLLKTPDVPHSARALIRQKAEGNPFFIEEVVRSLIDDGVIEYRDDRFRVTDRIHSVHIPGTIQDVIMARVDRLNARARHVLQVASVVGRSFYRRVIADLVQNHDELDAAIEVLKEKQLIFERQTRRTASLRRRTFAGEVEYVFKHALAQETVYESILQRTRKELHLKVAQAIEAGFADRLPDFYGMLAYHFGRAENLEKAEEYLFKAGDEAARSAASHEALTYFREASRLYLIIHGDGGDATKKALLEKNIGLALLNKGNLMECIDHFDRALELLGEPPPKSRLGVTVRSGLDLLAVLYRLYVPRRRARAVKVEPRDHEVFEVRYNRARAQATSDPQRFFFDTMGSIRRLGQTDAGAIDEACGMYAGAAALFAFSGVSFGIGRRFLDTAHGLVRTDSTRDLFVYKSMEFIHHYLEGQWGTEHEIPPDLVEQGLRYGRLWDVTAYIGFRCAIKSHQGDFAAVGALIDKLNEINDVFAYEFGKSHVYSQTAIALLEQRRLDEALQAIDVYYTSRHEEVLNVLALGMKAKAQVLVGDLNGAGETLAKTEALIGHAGRIPPWHLSEYVLGRLLYELTALEGATANGRAGSHRSMQRRAKRFSGEALAIAAKVAKPRTEAFRLTGRLYWLMGRHHEALRWWQRSIDAGTRLGARPELARTHLEIAERLSVPGGTDHELGGLDARGHLQRARDLFSAMGLAWDLERVGTLERRAA